MLASSSTQQKKKKKKKDGLQNLSSVDKKFSVPSNDERPLYMSFPPGGSGQGKWVLQLLPHVAKPRP
jgi:hypothetical protein